MKAIFKVLIPLGLILSSCEKNMKDHLADGLVDIAHVRPINHRFKDHYTIEKMVFLKKEKHSYNLIFKLSEDTSKEAVESYSLAIHAFAKESGNKRTEKRKYDYGWDFQPVIETYDKHKYIIHQIEAPVKRIDSISMFLYDRDKYKKKTYGKNLKVKNFGI